MRRLVYLELVKLKKSSMNGILLAITVLPILLIIVQYVVKDGKKVFFSTVSANNTIISMSIFSVVIIVANYIIAREYKERTLIYLFITPKSKTKILLSKYILLFLIILVLGALSFGTLIIANIFINGITSKVLAKLLGAWLIGTVMFFLLTSVVVYVALLRGDFISSLLISLVFFMFTCPFMFKNNYYIFPNLIPIVTVSNFLNINKIKSMDYIRSFSILGVVFLVFLYLSINRFNRKE